MVNPNINSYRTFHEKYAGSGIPGGFQIQGPPYFYDLWMTLINAHSNLASYTQIGSTVQGRPIYAFIIGNPNGGTVMWDACLHGWEDIGGELQYLIANWLLTSGTAEAQRILDGNRVVFIPDINHDSTDRTNYNTVDLNRDFATSPGQPETQAMRNAFQIFQPRVYLNGHYGGGPSMFHNIGPLPTIVNQLAGWIKDRIFAVWQSVYGRSFEPVGGQGGWWFNVDGYQGTPPPSNYATGAAYVATAPFAWKNPTTGADYPSMRCACFLWEIATDAGAPFSTETSTDLVAHNATMHTRQSMSDVQTWYYPRALQVFQIMCQAVEISTAPPPTQYTLTINLTGGKGWTSPQTTGTTVAYSAGTVVAITGYGNTPSPVDGLNYQLDHWLLDSVVVGSNGSPNPIQITMDKNHVLDAICVPVVAPTTKKLTVVSNPEINALVTIDGVAVGNTPISVDLTVGVQHTLEVASEVTK